MVEQRSQRLNQLERDLPEGLLVDAAWLASHGYPTNLRSYYVATGRLEQPARQVYRRPRGEVSWQQVVISLQTLLEYPLVVGGRTALDLQGYAHYVLQRQQQVHLYGTKRPPQWLHKLKLGVRFVYHNDRTLFRRHAVTHRVASLDSLAEQPFTSKESLVMQPWGQWNWPLVLSTPERAILELLDELPEHESFHQADVLMEGLSNLRPTRMQKLLEDCQSVKVKRLFLFFADRHAHAWSTRLYKNKIDLGEGKRMLVKGGVLDKTYQITVPAEMHAVR